MNTIFILIPTGTVARYILRSDIIRFLKASDLHIVILTPNADEPYFREEFSASNVFIEKYEQEKLERHLEQSKIQQWLLLLRSFVLKEGTHMTSIDTRLKITLEQAKGAWKKKGLQLMVHLLRKSRLARRLLLWAECRLFCPPFHGEIFRKYRPSLLVTPSMGNLWMDHYIMREASQHGTKVIPMILSWDNPSTKGMEGAPADHVIVWTDKMKEEIISYFDIPEGKVTVGGIAAFDIYRRPEKFMSRLQVFEKYGLDPKRKVILFGTRSPTSFTYNPDIVEIIAKAIAKGSLAEPCQVLVRLHPNHFKLKNGVSRFDAELKRYQALQERYGHIHLDVPEMLSSRLAVDMPSDDIVKLASMLRCTDVLITVYSTLIIEAALLDVPIVNPTIFTHHENLANSNKVALQYAHIVRIMDTGGVKISETAAQMIADINGYLLNPALDRANRQQIVENECANIGFAGEFIGRELVRLSIQNSNSA